MTDFGEVLVTGAGGFTGRFVVEELVAQGVKVRAMARSDSQLESLKSLGVSTIKADLANPESLPAAVEGVDAIIHVAAVFRQAGIQDDEYHKVNVEGTKHLMDLGIKYGVKRFIHCSTVGVHGNVENPPADESYRFQPGDIYQRSKCAGEKLVQSYLDQGKIRGVIIRPGMIYGPGDDRFLKLFKMVAQQKFFYVGDGMGQVHFIDVRDLAHAFYLALIKEEINNEVFIIAGEETMPLKEAASRISKIFRVPAPWIHLPVVPVQILGSIVELICVPFGINPPIYRRRVDFFTKHRCFNVQKAKNMLGWSAKQDHIAELVDAANAYIHSGKIDKTPISAPTIIHRKLDGTIIAVEGQIEGYFGNSTQNIVGSNINSLLGRSSNDAVKEAEKILEKNGSWLGSITHSINQKEREDLCYWKTRNDPQYGKIVLEQNRLWQKSSEVQQHVTKQAA